MTTKTDILGITVWVVILLSITQVCLATSTTHNFDGNVYDNEGNPLLGMTVRAWVNGEDRGSFITQNLGAGHESHYNIDVQGTTEEDLGQTIYFTINDVPAIETHLFEDGGDEDGFDLHQSTPTTTTTTSTTTTTISSTTSSTSTSTSTTTTIDGGTTTSSTTTTTLPSSSTTTTSVTTTTVGGGGDDSRDVKRLDYMTILLDRKCVNKTVTVEVRDQSRDRAIRKVDVDIFHDGQHIHNLETDRDGKVEFTPREVGKYEIKTEKSGYWDEENTVEIQYCGGETTTSTTTSSTTTSTTSSTTTTTEYIPPELVCLTEFDTGTVPGSGLGCEDVENEAKNLVAFTPRRDMTIASLEISGNPGAAVTISDAFGVIAESVEHTPYGIRLNRTVPLEKGQMYLIYIDKPRVTSSKYCGYNVESEQTRTDDGTWFIHDKWCPSNVTCMMAVKLYGEGCFDSSCVDNIMNQNETGLDCGGVCETCPTEPGYVGRFITLASREGLGLGLFVLSLMIAYVAYNRGKTVGRRESNDYSSMELVGGMGTETVSSTEPPVEAVKRKKPARTKATKSKRSKQSRIRKK